MIFEPVPENLLIAPSVAALKPWFAASIAHYTYSLKPIDGVIYFVALPDDMMQIFLSIPPEHL